MLANVSPEPIASTARESSGPKRIPSLDGLRAVAILLVVLSHAFGSKGLPWAPDWLSAILLNGPLGVQIFFVLSGFLITTLLLAEQDRNGTIDLGGFYRRRFFRIFPASYLYLGTVTLLSLAGIISVSMSLLVPSYLYVLNYQGLWGIEGEGYWFVGHFWTLCMEQQFYVLWPLALKSLTRRRAAMTLAALVATMPILRVVHYYAFPGVRGQLGMMFHTGSDAILIGSLLALCLRVRPELRQMIGAAKWPVAFLVGLWLFGVSVFLGAALGGWWKVLFSRTLNAVAAAFLLLWMVENPRSLFGRFLNTRTMIYMGTISYGLYLWQQLFLYQAGARPPMGVLAAVTGAFLVSALSFHFFESPLINWGRRRKTAAASA